MENIDFDSYKENIIIKGARLHNLKNISLAIPRQKYIVITGLSGSGKSTLAFDTLYAEGQRRYVESLSSYARQFMGKITKPEVDFIKGIPPAIAIEQKVSVRNTRSTVGTSTEIYDYIKLLFARIGKTISPVSGLEVKAHSVDDVVDFINSFTEGKKFTLLSPIAVPEGRTLKKHLEILDSQGISRVKKNGEIIEIADLNLTDKSKNTNDLFLLIDRFKSSKMADAMSRMSDSIQTAFYEGDGDCILEYEEDGEQMQRSFCTRFEADGIKFETPSVYTFTFNNPIGACPVCNGLGRVVGIDEDLVVPNKGLSVYDNAVKCWNGLKMSLWKDDFCKNASKYKFPIHRPYCKLTEEEKDILWKGRRGLHGIDEFFEMVEKESYKIQYRVMMSRYRGQTICPECKGTRLKKEAQYVKVGGKSISEIVKLPINEAFEFFNNLSLQETKK